ncbi:60S ribosomal protein L27a [Babesia sp. Xinjiang]|uniref:60S ribosomal protein L27a n=1 Tax=Babesia sp. Xinjiang TaxID=462227 RepID=UPI000A25E604|nr:60S ribosomal protein L27a [Babesia sp. Xinjiang]ORM40185.1 60S ribosomal protein L27a [Babesia sp. Xinjiang]
MYITVPLSARQRLAAQIYDHGTKTSLKVYHLQEYARFRAGLLPSGHKNDTPSSSGRTRTDSSRDVPFFRKIDDWRQLVAEVDACARELSPTQLLATAIAYWRLGRVGRAEWKRLCSAAAHHAYGPHSNVTGISASEVALILCCYARVFDKPVHSTTSLLRWIVRDVGQMNERDICMTLFYMRRMRCLPPTLDTAESQTYAAMLRAIVVGVAAEGGNKLPRFSPGGLVCLISNLAYIGHIPWGIVYHACNVIRRRAGELDAKTMAIHARSLSMLKFPDKGTLKAFAALICAQKQLDTATITCFLHSYAKLRFRPRGNFAGLLEQVHKWVQLPRVAIIFRGIFMFQDHEVAQIAFSLGQLGYRSPEVFESIFEFSKSAFTLSQSIAVLDACAVLGHFDQDAYNALLAGITRMAEVGMRYFHKIKNRYHCKTVNVDHLWSMVPQEEIEAAAKESGKAPVLDVVQRGYFKVLGTGNLPKKPLIVKARFFSKLAEKKIKEAGGACVLVA